MIALKDLEAARTAATRRTKAIVLEKLEDVMTPGFAAPFSREEAYMAGAFIESAFGETAASDSSMDLLPLLDIGREDDHE